MRRFLRDLTGVLLVVGVVVAAGVAWEQASPPSARRAYGPLIRVRATPGVPLVIPTTPGRRIEIDHGPPAPDHRLDLASLARTAATETLVAGLVIALSVSYRR